MSVLGEKNPKRWGSVCEPSKNESTYGKTIKHIWPREMMSHEMYIPKTPTASAKS